MPGAKFPSLAGQLFPTKTPAWSTLTARAVSGREVETQTYATAIWEFDLPFEVLSDMAVGSAVGQQSFQELLGFWMATKAAADTFLFQDPDDSVASQQALGTADGTTTAFLCTHTFAGPGGGGFTEPVGQVEPAGLLVYINGVSVPSGGGGSSPGWSVVAPNVIQFAFAPAAGRNITASYSFYFVCRFDADTLPMKKLAQGLWSNDGLKFHTAKP